MKILRNLVGRVIDSRIRELEIENDELRGDLVDALLEIIVGGPQASSNWAYKKLEKFNVIKEKS